jgi:uncharacterized protein
MSDDWQAFEPANYETYAWNSKKAAVNETKHGIKFTDAVQVFENPFAGFETFEEGEWRSLAIGWSFGRLIAVVYTEPEEGLCRIVSARPATARERRTFGDLFG